MKVNEGAKSSGIGSPSFANVLNTDVVTNISLADKICNIEKQKLEGKLVILGDAR